MELHLLFSILLKLQDLSFFRLKYCLLGVGSTGLDLGLHFGFSLPSFKLVDFWIYLEPNSLFVKWRVLLDLFFSPFKSHFLEELKFKSGFRFDFESLFNFLSGFEFDSELKFEAVSVSEFEFELDSELNFETVSVSVSKPESGS